jgi:HSP20 family protein
MARDLIRFNPFAGFDSLERRILQNDFLRPFRSTAFPTTDIYTEDDNQLSVEAHLPGFAEKDISVDIDQGALVIHAERHEKEEDKKKKYVVRESSSSYYRRIDLPEQADESGVQARFEEGVLTVTVPFKELAAPKKIAISSAKKA